jgi:hypothetical protein
MPESTHVGAPTYTRLHGGFTSRIHQILAVLFLVHAAPARADVLGSVGLGPIVEPTRWTGPGEVDPGEISLSTTSIGGGLPLRLTVTQNVARRYAAGVVLGLTPIIADMNLGQSTSSSRVILDAMARISFRPQSCWSVQLGAGVAVEKVLGRGDNAILSNDNVEPFEDALLGGVVALSFTLYGDARDYTFDLRAALMSEEHRRAVPVMLTASLEWGRDR